MRITLTIADKAHTIDLSRGVGLSIPLRFNATQPTVYQVPGASSAAYRSGPWVGDTRQGGSCNFETLQLTPHCNGTHTECIGHITNERLNICDVKLPLFIPATVVDITPATAASATESYQPALTTNDKLITANALKAALNTTHPAFCKAIVVRTLPNSEAKLTHNYDTAAAPFFTLDAIEYLNTIGCEHLLVDTPSIDRMYDEGMLSCHHLFWNVPQGTHNLTPQSFVHKTITEFLFIPEAVKAGSCIISIHPAPFASDAAPSNVQLFQIA